MPFFSQPATDVIRYNHHYFPLNAGIRGIPRSEAFSSQPATDPRENNDDCTGIGCWLTEKCLGSRTSEFDWENSSVRSAGKSCKNSVSVFSPETVFLVSMCSLENIFSRQENALIL